MAFTKYTKDTKIIGALGTNPAERGLTTQEFKDKFDQFADEFVTWFNETHLPEVAEKAVVDEHKADYASKQFGDIPYTTTQNITYYVDEVNGNDSNDGLTSGTAFRTWAKVESMIPMFVLRPVNIRIIGNISGVYLRNRVISGTLTIIGDTENKANHVMSFSSNVPFRGIVGGSDRNTGSSIKLQYFTINENFHVTGCTSFELVNMSLRQIYFSFSKAYTLFCEYSGTGNGIYADHQSHVTSFNASGTVDGYGLYAYFGSVIAKRGPQPTGNTANEFTQYGGVIR